MISSILDLETNAAYSRERVAALRAMGSETPFGRCMSNRGNGVMWLQLRLGAGLIAISERASRVFGARRAAPAARRLLS